MRGQSGGREPGRERPRRVRRAPVTGRALVRQPEHSLPSLEVRAAIPEERIWLEAQQSPETRRAYREDVAHFPKTMGVTQTADFRKVDSSSMLRLSCGACWRRDEWTPRS